MNSFSKIINHPIKFRLYLLKKLPAAFFSGVKIVRFTEEECTTSIPFKWLTQNPFRSTYFASLSMAAELSTGALIMSQLYAQSLPIASLVIKMEARYFKKATGITFFTCHDGLKIKEAVQQAAQNDEPVQITLQSIGKNKNGEEIAAFEFTWSLKKKSRPSHS